LSPFLNRGFISEYFKRSGKIPDDNDLLHMWVRGELMNGELIFNTLVGISSYPWELFNFRDLIIFSTSLVDKDLSLMCQCGDTGPINLITQ
jgi:DNA-directed RNA polymerase beta subunit